MIIGLGIDVIEVERIDSVIRRQGQQFLRHVFTDSERARAPESEAAAASYYAGRWSAKEAVAKTFGTGIGAACGWKDIEIVRWPSGQPSVQLSGAASETAAKLGIRRIHLTISHEKRLACASAVAEG
ncbi:MAG: holo-ACP synthase [Lentisphaeria bacterium]